MIIYNYTYYLYYIDEVSAGPPRPYLIFLPRAPLLVELCVVSEHPNINQNDDGTKEVSFVGPFVMLVYVPPKHVPDSLTDREIERVDERLNAARCGERNEPC